MMQPRFGERKVEKKLHRELYPEGTSGCMVPMPLRLPHFALWHPCGREYQNSILIV